MAISKTYTDMSREEWDKLPILARRIRKLLERDGITANQLGEKCGISPSVMKSYLNNDVDIGIKALKKLADAFDVSADYLLGRTKFQTVKASKKATMKTTGLSEKAVDALIPHAQDWQSRTISRLLEEYPYFLPVLANIAEYTVKYGELEAIKAAYIKESQEIAKEDFDLTWEKLLQNPRKITADMVKERKLLVKAFRFSIYESLMVVVDKLVEKTYKEEKDNNGRKKKTAPGDTSAESGQ